METFIHDWTLFSYPLATCIHWLIGSVSGILATHNHPRDRFISAMLACWFLVYEGLEFAHIHDNVDADIANGAAVWILSAACRALWIHRMKIKRNAYNLIIRF